MGFIRFALHLLHSRFSTIFLVVFAFLWNTGFVWPPKPACLLSYRRFPCAISDAFPVLYCVTLCVVCFLQRLQKVLRDFGTFTIFSRQTRELERGLVKND